MRKMSEKQLRKVLSEEEYLEHYREMVLRKVELGLPMKESEKCFLPRILSGGSLSLAGIELTENLED